MPAMNYKEATGVRARTDLTANAKPTRLGAMTDQELALVAEHLAKHAREERTLSLTPALCRRLADAILEVLNREGDR